MVAAILNNIPDRQTTPVKYEITTLIDKTTPVKNKITTLIEKTTPVNMKLHT